jgi:hypothetical protein
VRDKSKTQVQTHFPITFGQKEFQALFNINVFLLLLVSSFDLTLTSTLLNKRNVTFGVDLLSFANNLNMLGKS